MRGCYARLWAFSNCNRLRGAPAEAGALADLHDAARRSGRIASFLQQNDAVDVSGYPRFWARVGGSRQPRVAGSSFPCRRKRQQSVAVVFILLAPRVDLGGKTNIKIGADRVEMV